MNNQLARQCTTGKGKGRGGRYTICLCGSLLQRINRLCGPRVMDMLSENWAGLRGNDIDDSAQGAGIGRARQRKIERDREREQGGLNRDIVNQL